MKLSSSCRRRLAVVLGVALCATAASAAAQPAEELFIHRNATARVTAAQIAQSGGGRSAIVSRVEVGIRIEALFDRPNGVASTMLINAGDHAWTARLERVDVDPMGFRSWVGRLDGVADSHVVITERAGVVSGLINALGVVYQLRTSAPGVHLLERVDTARLPDEPEPLTAPEAAGSARLTVAADDASVIDVLMLYTPAARAVRGGTAQMQALVAQIISDTNTAFARSAITPRVRLIGSQEVAFVESAQMGADLASLRSSTEARNLRDLARADLVQLLVSSPDHSSCGVGYLLTSLTATNFDAYSVADIACAAQYTPTHEMGHNMGSQHAPDDGSGEALFSYSYAFKDPGRGFRTVMAYSCVGASCPRVPNFSNPLVMQNGGPTGTSAQDNARSINEAAFTVANFRQSGGATLTRPAAPRGLRSTVVGSNVTVAWDPVLSDELMQPSTVSAYVLQAGTAPGSSNLFNASIGGATSASGVLPSGAYFWRVLAVNAAGASAPSAEAQFSVGCAPPAAPANFRFSLSGSVVTLAWNPPAEAPPIQYVIEAGSAPSLTDIIVAPVGAQTSIATTAPPGTYYVRVRAQNACGTSTPSNEHVIVVP